MAQRALEREAMVRLLGAWPTMRVEAAAMLSLCVTGRHPGIAPSPAGGDGGDAVATGGSGGGGGRGASSASASSSSSSSSFIDVRVVTAGSGVVRIPSLQIARDARLVDVRDDLRRREGAHCHVLYVGATDGRLHKLEGQTLLTPRGTHCTVADMGWGAAGGGDVGDGGGGGGTSTTTVLHVLPARPAALTEKWATEIDTAHNRAPVPGRADFRTAPGAVAVAVLTRHSTRIVAQLTSMPGPGGAVSDSRGFGFGNVQSGKNIWVPQSEAAPFVDDLRLLYDTGSGCGGRTDSVAAMARDGSVWLVTVLDGKCRKIFPANPAAEGALAFAVSPNLQWLVFRAAGRKDVHLVIALPPGQQRGFHDLVGPIDDCGSYGSRGTATADPISTNNGSRTTSSASGGGGGGGGIDGDGNGDGVGSSGGHSGPNGPGGGDAAEPPQGVGGGAKAKVHEENNAIAAAVVDDDAADAADADDAADAAACDEDDEEGPEPDPGFGGGGADHGVAVRATTVAHAAGMAPARKMRTAPQRDIDDRTGIRYSHQILSADSAVFSMTQDGAGVAVVSATDGELALWLLRDPKALTRRGLGGAVAVGPDQHDKVKFTAAFRSGAQCCAASANGERLAVAVGVGLHRVNVLSLLGGSSGVLLRTLANTRLNTAGAHQAAVTSLVMSADGRCVAATANEFVVVWDVEAGTQIWGCNTTPRTALGFACGGSGLLVLHKTNARVLGVARVSAQAMEDDGTASSAAQEREGGVRDDWEGMLRREGGNRAAPNCTTQ